MALGTSHQRDVIEVLGSVLPSLPDIGAVQLVRTPRAPTAQRRLSDEPGVLPLLERGAEIRKVEGLPFWDSVLLAAERLPGGLPKPLAEAAGYHQHLSDDPSLVAPVDDSLDLWLRSRTSGLGPGEVVSISSRVTRNDGTVAHVPMLDFSARTENSGSLKSAISIVEQLGIPGSLLNSGRSFHFYGHKLLTPDGLARFLGNALLYSPLVDGRWAAHQLLNGYCALRVSPGRDGSLPTEVIC